VEFFDLLNVEGGLTRKNSAGRNTLLCRTRRYFRLRSPLNGSLLKISSKHFITGAGRRNVLE